MVLLEARAGIDEAERLGVRVENHRPDIPGLSRGPRLTVLHDRLSARSDAPDAWTHSVFSLRPWPPVH